MDRQRIIIGIGAVALAVGGLLVGSAAMAQEQPSADELATASAAALAAVPGTVLEVERERENGQVVYEVEIWPLDGSRVVEVLVDPSTGQVLGTEVDDDEDELEFSGTVEALPPTGLVGIWQVNGRAVRVTEATEIDQRDGAIAVGSLVEVEGVPLSDGSIQAAEVEIDDDDDDDDEDGPFGSIPGLFGDR